MKNFKFCCLTLSVISVLGCVDKLPPYSTVEYKIKHGVIDGKKTELLIKNIIFEFPSKYNLNVYTSADKSSDIKRGQADKVNFHMDFSHLYQPSTSENSEYESLVRIEINKHGYEHISKIDNYFNSEEWKNSEFRKDLELEEWVRVHGGWGYLTYKVINENFKTPKGNPIVYYCVGVENKPPEQCRTYYEHPRGTVISYYLSGKLLSQWKKVHTEVVAEIDSMITN